MMVGETLAVAFRSIRANKLRSALTMLGIIIGVGAVITMVALGTGARTTIEERVKSAGTNMIMVNAGNFSMGGARTGSGGAQTLTVEDATAIRNEVRGVRYLCPGFNSRGQVIYQNQNWQTRIQGTDVELPLIRSWPTEWQQNAKVICQE